MFSHWIFADPPHISTQRRREAWQRIGHTDTCFREASVAPAGREQQLVIAKNPGVAGPVLHVSRNEPAHGGRAAVGPRAQGLDVQRQHIDVIDDGIRFGAMVTTAVAVTNAMMVAMVSVTRTTVDTVTKAHEQADEYKPTSLQNAGNEAGVGESGSLELVLDVMEALDESVTSTVYVLVLVEVTSVPKKRRALQQGLARGRTAGSNHSIGAQVFLASLVRFSFLEYESGEQVAWQGRGCAAKKGEVKRRHGVRR
ncbi:hypothetical protein PG997_014410 [Apiospora hydei]|uniref:Uncharacterized protein n=1 Tax=Apiospora hydei TaxID=1337664 RepID=A0ABR1UWY3_9PEZI